MLPDVSEVGSGLGSPLLFFVTVFALRDILIDVCVMWECLSSFSLFGYPLFQGTPTGGLLRSCYLSNKALIKHFWLVIYLQLVYNSE